MEGSGDPLYSFLQRYWNIHLSQTKKFVFLFCLVFFFKLAETETEGGRICGSGHLIGHRRRERLKVTSQFQAGMKGDDGTRTKPRPEKEKYNPG